MYYKIEKLLDLKEIGLFLKCVKLIHDSYIKANVNFYKYLNP